LSGRNCSIEQKMLDSVEGSFFAAPKWQSYF